MKLKWIWILFLGVLISGCSGAPNDYPDEEEKKVRIAEFTNSDIVKIIPICDDGVVCYTHNDGSDGTGFSCIKDESLSLKYCRS